MCLAMAEAFLKKKLGKLITHTHDKISRLWQAWVCSALTRYRAIATQRWLKTFLQYNHIQKNYYEIKQININNKRYFALKLLNVLNWGLQYLSKHYNCISQCSGIRLVCHCSASASCSVFSWCSTLPPVCAFRCWVFQGSLSQRVSNIKNLLHYVFQTWREDLSDISFVTLRWSLWYNVITLPSQIDVLPGISVVVGKMSHF